MHPTSPHIPVVPVVEPDLATLVEAILEAWEQDVEPMPRWLKARRLIEFFAALDSAPEQKERPYD